MDISKQSKIGVLCGGISSERDISLRSGNNCYQALINKGYSNTKLIDIKSINDLVNLKDKLEIAFLITHGKFGEDGIFQGILEWLEIPYTGSSVTASAIAMDKWLTKQIAKSIGINTPNAYLLKKNRLAHDSHFLWNHLSLKNNAIFIKPIDDGSSVDTFKITSEKELQSHIAKLELKRATFLAEECIEGQEVTVSIIEVGNELNVLPILELKPKNAFYDYEAKYTKGLTEFILPAKISPIVKNKLENDSIQIFSSIGLSGFARVDFIIDKNDNPYLLEVNSLPGMTDTSDLPAQAKHAGIEYNDLVEIILQSAKLHKSGSTKQNTQSKT